MRAGGSIGASKTRSSERPPLSSVLSQSSQNETRLLTGCNSRPSVLSTELYSSLSLFSIGGFLKRRRTHLRIVSADAKQVSYCPVDVRSGLVIVDGPAALRDFVKSFA